MYVHFIPDRIVVHGQQILHGIVPGSAQPFNFKKEFHLSEEEVVKCTRIIHAYVKCREPKL